MKIHYPVLGNAVMAVRTGWKLAMDSMCDVKRLGSGMAVVHLKSNQKFVIHMHIYNTLNFIIIPVHNICRSTW